jgi:hypothetical protein
LLLNKRNGKGNYKTLIIDKIKKGDWTYENRLEKEIF